MDQRGVRVPLLGRKAEADRFFAVATARQAANIATRFSFSTSSIVYTGGKPRFLGGCGLRSLLVMRKLSVW